MINDNIFWCFRSWQSLIITGFKYIYAFQFQFSNFCTLCGNVMLIDCALLFHVQWSTDYSALNNCPVILFLYQDKSCIFGPFYLLYCFWNFSLHVVGSLPVIFCYDVLFRDSSHPFSVSLSIYLFIYAFCLVGWVCGMGFWFRWTH